MKVTFSTHEIKDIVISTIALGIIFSISKTGVFAVLSNTLGFLSVALLITIIVALSFIPHELAHKYAAIHYNCFAQYEMWKNGLLFALFLAVAFGFVFAAPGAVVIYTAYRSRHGLHQIVLSPRQNGLISIAGPLTNIIIALLFFLLAPSFFLTGDIVFINVFLAGFNLVPVHPLDGSKVFYWNKLVWLCMMLVVVTLFSLT